MAHTHIHQKAYPPGLCPSCDLLWDLIRNTVPTSVLDLDTEFQVAETLKKDYSEKEAHEHLTKVAKTGTHIKAVLDQHKETLKG